MRWWALVIAMVALPAGAARAQVSRTVVYGDTASNLPLVRTWDGSAWSALVSTYDVGGSPRWVVAKASPTRSEIIAVVEDSSEDLNVLVHNGTAWSTPLEVASNLGTSGDRPFYLAYEQASGDALLVYRRGGINSVVYYRTWNGSAWSGEGSVSLTGSGAARFIKLVPKPGSNEIMVLVLDNARDLSALVWDGASFTGAVLLAANTNAAGSELFDAAYESISGRAVVVWTPGGSTAPAYRLRSAGAWLVAGTLPDIGGVANWLRLAPDPGTNRLILLSLDTQRDVNAVVWSGAAWGTPTEFETGAPDSDRRAMDVAFEPGGTRALAMYARAGTGTPIYRTFDGAAWSAAQAGPDLTHPPSVIQFLPALSGPEILVALERKGDGALCVMRWTGAALAGAQVLAPDMPGTSGNECFMIAGRGGQTRPRVLSWAEVAPSAP